MPSSYPITTRVAHNLDGYEPVYEVITDWYVYNVNGFGENRSKREGSYKNIRYDSVELAMQARQRDVDEDKKETHRFQTQITEHHQQGQDTIYQHSRYKITSVKGVDKSWTLESEVFIISKLQFATLDEAKQKRKLNADNKRKQQQVNEHALQSFACSGQESINELLKAIGTLKDIIKRNPADEHRYAIQLKDLTISYEAEKLAHEASLLESKLNGISIEQRPMQIQKIKDLYAKAIELGTAKQKQYKEKRAKVNQVKLDIEEKIVESNQKEHQLHQTAKAAARLCEQKPNAKNFELALKAYDAVIHLNSKNIEDYKAERRVINLAFEALENELELHQKALHLATLAQKKPSSKNFDLALKAYDAVIHLESENINLYKAERRVIYSASVEFNSHQEALVLAMLARNTPSIETYDNAIQKYNHLIENIANKPCYVVERTLLERETTQFISQQQDNALQTIRQWRAELATKNPQQRLLQHANIIRFCEESNLGLNLQLFINEARTAIQIEQSVLDKYAQAQALFSHIGDFSGQTRIDNYQRILNLLNDIIVVNTAEKNIYQNLKDDVARAKNAYLQSIIQIEDDEIEVAEDEFHVDILEQHQPQYRFSI